jgi:hypothetical protein
MYAAAGAAVEVLDYYHLSEHLDACAQAVWGVGSAEAQQWARRVGGQVLEGDAGVVRTALRRLRPPTAAGQQAVVDLQRYVRTHAHRMRYGALAAGLCRGQRGPSKAPTAPQAPRGNAGRRPELSRS